MDLGKQSVADLANPQIIIKGRDECLDMGLTYRQEDWKKKLLWQFWDLNVPCLHILQSDFTGFCHT